MPISSPSSSVPRSPLFLGQARGHVEGAPFGGSTTTMVRRVVPFFQRVEGPGLPPPPPPREEGAEANPAAGVETLAPPLPPPPPQPDPELVERLTKAINDLRVCSQRLGEQAQADAVEMGVIIARRILERELGTGPAPLYALVRSAISRLGEARKITVRLCPSDAAAVNAAGEAGPVAGLSIARVEIMQDGSLAPGDCIVDGEHGTVDGRLSVRLDEVRRILNAALAESEKGEP